MIDFIFEVLTAVVLGAFLLLVWAGMIALSFFALNL